MGLTRVAVKGEFAVSIRRGPDARNARAWHHAFIKPIMCDPDTGNIGWDMSKDANAGETVEELHKRDKDTYKQGKSGRSDEHVWI